jgi:hypothetical protein
MTRNALYFAILTVLIAFLSGVGLGIVSSKRVNTVAVEAYQQSLDLQARATWDAKIAAKDASCQEQVAGVQRQVTNVTNAALQEAADVEAGAKLERIAYTERILWLQEQLRVHGIPERIVKP